MVPGEKFPEKRFPRAESRGNSANQQRQMFDDKSMIAKNKIFIAHVFGTSQKRDDL